MGDKMSNDAMLQELMEIRKLLTPPPKPEPPKGLLNEFVDFISQYKVLGLAVAFILGIYIGQVVQALVNSFIMPLIQIVIPGIGGGTEGTVYVLAAGPIIDSLITFIVVAFVVFIIVKIATRIGIG
ncbi:MAG: MscL family protein [Candidatus Thorarchaeota archaeon]|jgi:large conductance mechanosensitive channel